MEAGASGRNLRESLSPWCADENQRKALIPLPAPWGFAFIVVSKRIARKTSPGAKHSPAIQNNTSSEAKTAVGTVRTRNPLAALKQECGTSHSSEVSFLEKG